MAGHSKWAKLKHVKGTTDGKRAALWGKLVKEVAVAARIGGQDPAGNSRLRLAIDKAARQSVPKDNIERAIARASGDLGGADYVTMMYEGYGPGGIAILVQCLTDNRARTASDVKDAFNKGGGTIGSPGSVLYMFAQKAEFTVKDDDLTEDQVMAAALDGGADDVVDNSDGSFEVTAAFEAYGPCRSALEKLPNADVSGAFAWIPETTVAVADADAAKALMKLIDRIEDCDDVQETFTNAEISDAIAEQMA